ncbi:hypothetical protein HZH68_003374 [Vespula germanica]|uniref:Secreted protein n=2 Tax=Vespula TaxID=7451 RepID=A0A834U2W5_VESGE|nr:hypothetical protein HZH68_003374 [Vespula germanica]KAF7435548.1 hypothetical protein H0235_003739 [Vespula pensylvanica]
MDAFHGVFRLEWPILLLLSAIRTDSFARKVGVRRSTKEFSKWYHDESLERGRGIKEGRKKSSRSCSSDANGDPGAW